MQQLHPQAARNPTALIRHLLLLFRVIQDTEGVERAKTKQEQHEYNKAQAVSTKAFLYSKSEQFTRRAHE